MEVSENMQLEIPVVFFIFNRKPCTARVFKSVRDVKPKQLFLIADGPGSDGCGGADRCREVRGLVERAIDWDCRIFKNYSEQNLGFQRRIVSGLNWVFEQTEQAIILEDDCLPDVTFFRFCQELLQRYAKEERIMSISGNNFVAKKYPMDFSYCFSHYMHCWGWATWRRAWQRYDDSIRSGLQPKPKKKAHFDRIFAGKIDTWHSTWVYNIWDQGGLNILPDQNLVSNIGLDAEADHP